MGRRNSRRGISQRGVRALQAGRQLPAIRRSQLSERIIDGQAHKFEILRLPLSDDDKAVNMLLICPLYFEKPPIDPVLGGQEKREFTPPRTIKND